MRQDFSIVTTIKSLQCAFVKCSAMQKNLSNGSASSSKDLREQWSTKSRHATVLENLRAMRDQYGFEFSDLTDAEGFEEFVESEQFQEWLADAT